MGNKKLQQIGSKLGVSEKDIAAIRKERIKRTLRHLFIGAIVIACSSFLGFLIGTCSPAENGGGYPYAAPGLGLIARPRREKGLFVLVFILVTILLSVVGAMAAYKAGQHSAPVPEYNVFSRQK